MAYLDNTEVVWEDSEMVEPGSEDDLLEFEDRVYSTLQPKAAIWIYWIKF
jgi:hypothetical protein